MSVRLSKIDCRVIDEAATAILSPSRFASESEWHLEILRAIKPLTNAYKAAVRVPDGPGFRMTPSGFEESAIREHREYYHRFDLGRALGGPGIHAHVFSRNEYYAARLESLKRGEYYTDYLARYRVFDALCLSTAKQDMSHASIIYLWHERDLPQSARRHALDVLRLLVPVFRSGMAIAPQLLRRKADFFAAIDILPFGCALFASDGVLIHQNPSLSTILVESKDSRLLQHAVDEAATGLRRLFFSSRPQLSDSLTFRDRVVIGSVLYTLSASALLESTAGHCPGIFVTVEQQHQQLFPARIPTYVRSSLRLTEREGEIALLLAQRKTNSEIAKELGLSEHTVRHHTENVMSKLGVSSRIDVAPLILGRLSHHHDEHS